MKEKKMIDIEHINQINLRERDLIIEKGLKEEEGTNQKI